MIRLGNNEKGVVLISTLAVVAILLTAAIQISRLAQNAAEKTMVQKEMVSAGHMAMAGIHLGMLVLSRDAADNETDSVQESWADPEKLGTAVQTLGYDPGKLTLQIEDELGKIQLNALLKQFPGNEINTDQQMLLERFFYLAGEQLDLPEDRPDFTEILNSLKDWLDTNDADAITGLSGAESDYYQSLETPYNCSNGPFNHLDEIFNVKGMSKDMAHIKFPDVFTVFGMNSNRNEQGRYDYKGKININTAPASVIAALLPEGREHLAQDLADFRLEKPAPDQEFTNRLEKGWVEQVIELSDKEKLAFVNKISYSSHIYRIICNAEKNGAVVRMSAVVKREKSVESGRWICRIIQMEKG